MSCCLCFPPSAKVLTTNGYIAIADLDTSHKLLTVGQDKGAAQPTLKRTGFCAYLHANPELESEFLIMKCDNNSQLTISAHHLLFRAVEGKSGQPKATLAKNISIGDMLVFVDAAQGTITRSKVVEIQTKIIKGVFAPLTGKGTLIVDGFQVSCYAEVKSHDLAHTSMALLRLWCRSGQLVKAKNGAGQMAGKSAEIHPFAKVLIAIDNALPVKHYSNV